MLAMTQVGRIGAAINGDACLILSPIHRAMAALAFPLTQGSGLIWMIGGVNKSSYSAGGIHLFSELISATGHLEVQSKHLKTFAFQR